MHVFIVMRLFSAKRFPLLTRWHIFDVYSGFIEELVGYYMMCVVGTGCQAKVIFGL